MFRRISQNLLHFLLITEGPDCKNKMSLPHLRLSFNGGSPNHQRFQYWNGLLGWFAGTPMTLEPIHFRSWVALSPLALTCRASISHADSRIFITPVELLGLKQLEPGRASWKHTHTKKKHETCLQSLPILDALPKQKFVSWLVDIPIYSKRWQDYSELPIQGLAMWGPQNS